MKQKWNERFDTKDYFYGEEANTFLEEETYRFKEGSKILSLGDGEGRNAVYLATKGHQSYSLDMSSVGLEKGKILAQKLGVEIETILTDLNHYQFEKDHWDGITSIWCHVPTDLRIKLYRQIKQGLAPGGIFLLEAYTKEQLKYNSGGPKALNMFPSKEELEEAFSGFDILVSQELEREIHEGAGHNGMSCVLQFIAKKNS